MQSEENYISVSPVPDADFFERVGGEPFFIKLVERFYDLVESDLVLRPLYPPNLEPGKVNLAAFLTQYWGGPPHYSLERGHPRIRMRHANFSIGQTERDTWVEHMTTAVRSMNLEANDVDKLIAYFERTATFLKNRS